MDTIRTTDATQLYFFSHVEVAAHAFFHCIDGVQRQYRV